MLSLGQGLNSSTGLITGVPTPITPVSFSGLSRWFTQPTTSSAEGKWSPLTSPNTEDYRFNQEDTDHIPTLVTGTPSALDFTAGDEDFMYMGNPESNTGAIVIAEALNSGVGNFTMYVMLERDGLGNDAFFGKVSDQVDQDTFFGMAPTSNTQLSITSHGSTFGVSSIYQFNGTPFAANDLIMLVMTREDGTWTFKKRGGTPGDYTMDTLTLSSSTNTANKGKFIIGALAHDTDVVEGTKYFDGKIYEIIYYNRLLNNTEQEDLFSQYLNPRYASIT